MRQAWHTRSVPPVSAGNEADVRAEIADPFLAALGYRRGTTANIDREFRLTYDRHFLGRKKPTDKPLVGKADYRLSVLGFGHWVLDAKAYDVEIDRDAIEQAISYAAHPEVAGHYAAVLNGKQFVMYRATQSSHEAPLVDLEVTSGEALAEALMNLLSLRQRYDVTAGHPSLTSERLSQTGCAHQRGSWAEPFNIETGSGLPTFPCLSRRGNASVSCADG